MISNDRRFSKKQILLVENFVNPATVNFADCIVINKVKS